jgi:hypothetical protein
MSCRLDDGHASASCIRGVGVCRIGRRQLCRKLAVAKANGMRLVGTGSVNVWRAAGVGGGGAGGVWLELRERN